LAIVWLKTVHYPLSYEPSLKETIDNLIYYLIRFGLHKSNDISIFIWLNFHKIWWQLDQNIANIYKFFWILTQHFDIQFSLIFFEHRYLNFICSQTFLDYFISLSILSGMQFHGYYCMMKKHFIPNLFSFS
jgi:hypothetical protein